MEKYWESCQGEALGCYPLGRPRKTWSQYVEEDLAVLGIEEATAMARDRSISLIVSFDYG